MAKTFEECIAELYRSPLEQFVAERKRLAAELKGAEDKEGAKRLEKLARPSISAWAVNQLWWQERASFETLFESAGRLRSGDLGAMRAHRAALDGLRARAAEILSAGSHATGDPVLRRVSNTLSALAATGGFDPDEPGALAADRDAPGFGATGLSGMLAGASPSPGSGASSGSDEREAAARPDDAAQREREAERQRIEQERQRIEQQRAAVRAERLRLESELKRARADVDAHAREVERLRIALAAAEQALSRVRSAAADIDSRLARLDED